MDDSAVLDEKKQEAGKVPEPKGMVTYDPDHPSYGHRHVCFILRKVNDALHGYTDEESPEEY